MEWVYRYMVGIDTCKDAPGYKRFAIRPYPGGGIRFAKADLETVRGRISCRWTDSEKSFVLEFTVPSNTAAEVTLPEFVEAIADTCGLTFREEAGHLLASAPAGSYRIVCDKRALL